MSKNFLNYYLEEADTEYVYKLKFACDDFSDEQLEKLETALSKYDLKSIEPMTRTPIQEHPLDFPNIKNSRVYITKITLGYPASHDMLRQYVSESSGVHIAGVAVYSQHDPRESYTEHMLKIKDDSWREEYEAKLGTDHEQDVDVSELYGKSYNDAFLDRESEKRKNRRIDTVTNSLIPDQVTDNEGVAPEDSGEAGGLSVLGNKKLSESKSTGLARVRDLVITFNEETSGNQYKPMGYTDVGMRTWTRGDGIRHRDLGTVVPVNNSDTTSIGEFWNYLQALPRAKNIGKVSGEFGSSRFDEAISYGGLFFKLTNPTLLIEWGSLKRITNPNSVWRIQK